MKDTKSNKNKDLKKVSVSEKDVKVLSNEEINEAYKKEKLISSKKAKQSKSQIYISYGTRMLIYVVLLTVFFALSLLFARKTLTKEDTVPINYTEKETIDYKVYLKENDFYTEKYLAKDKAYIASLIDYIDINLSYVFNIERLTKMDVDYKVIGELVIENANGSNKYYEKEYTILDTKEKKINGANEFSVNEDVKINYDYYNELANRFRNSYGVDTNSYLKVYLLLNKKTDSNLNYTIDESTKVDNIIIPLSQRAIEIKINSASNSSTKYVIPKPSIKVNIGCLIGEIVGFLISAFAVIKIVKYVTVLIKTISPYDKYVNKLLKEYDRLIVETNNVVDLSKYNIIEVSRFNELLDVRDNIKMPINYYNITKHEKGIFYIKNNDDIYLLTLKNIDLKAKKIRV